MSNEYINWGDLVSYPNCDKIYWTENVGKSLYFTYNDEPHSLVIKGAHRAESGHSTIVAVTFDNGIEKEIRSERLKDMPFAKIYPRYSNRYSVGDIINGLIVLEVINRKHKVYNHNRKYYKVRCGIDGYTYEIAESDLLNGYRCPVCQNKKVLPGINDLATTDSWMVEYFDDKEFAKKYTAKSRKEVLLKCPTCHRKRTQSIETLHRYGFRCDYCSDKISYPNKFMTSVMLQLENEQIIKNYKREYKADWSNNYSYDNYFEFNGKKFIIEMDGGFHYRDNTLSHQSVDFIKSGDFEKDKLAFEHGIKMIRIDCNYSDMTLRFSYIRDNVLNSLSSIIDLSIIDWEKVRAFAENNLLSEICECYTSGMSREEICNKYNYLSNVTIGTYLHTGTLCGLCCYEPSHSKKYRCYKLMQKDTEVEKTDSYRKMDTILKEKYGISLSKSQFFRKLKSNLPIKDSFYIIGELF